MQLTYCSSVLHRPTWSFCCPCLSPTACPISATTPTSALILGRPGPMSATCGLWPRSVRCPVYGSSYWSLWIATGPFVGRIPSARFGPISEHLSMSAAFWCWSCRSTCPGSSNTKSSTCTTTRRTALVWWNRTLILAWHRLISLSIRQYSCPLSWWLYR